MKVSVIILNWNGRDHLKECLQSVLATHYRPIEILVVDNNSTDDSLDVVDESDNITIIRNKTNLGYAGGNNAGIAAAQGEFIVTLNNDVVVDPNWLDEAVEYFKKDPLVGIVSCRQMNYFDREKVDTLYSFPEKHLLLGRMGHNKLYAENAAYASPGFVLSANGASAIYRKKLLMELNGFADEFFAYQEECDLHMRAFLHNWKCIYSPKSIVYHKSGASFGKRPSTFYYYHERNRIWFIYRNFPLTLILRNLPIIIFRELRTFLRVAVLSRMPHVYMKSRIDGFAGLSAFSRVRKDNMRLFNQKKSEFEEFFSKSKLPLSY